ncbi:hypothetical protein GZH46_02813, partial [Fragariocoptes setiger]
MEFTTPDDIAGHPLIRLVRIMLCMDDPWWPRADIKDLEEELIRVKYRAKKMYATGNSNNNSVIRKQNHKHEHHIINKLRSRHPDIESVWTYNYGVGYCTTRLSKLFYARMALDALLIAHHINLLIHCISASSSPSKSADIPLMDQLDLYYGVPRFRANLHALIVTGLVAQWYLYFTSYCLRHRKGPCFMIILASIECKHAALCERYVRLAIDLLESPYMPLSVLQTSQLLCEMEQIVSLIRVHNRMLNHSHNELEPIRMPSRVFSLNKASKLNRQSDNYWSTICNSHKNHYITRQQIDKFLSVQKIIFRFPFVDKFYISIDHTFGGYLVAVHLMTYIITLGLVYLYILVVIQSINAVQELPILWSCVRSVYIMLNLAAFVVPLTLSMYSAAAASCISFELIRLSNAIIRALRAMRYKCKLIRALKSEHTHSQSIMTTTTDHNYDSSNNSNNNNNNDNNNSKAHYIDATLQCTARSSLQYMDALAINLMIITSTFLSKLPKLDYVFGAPVGAFLCWVISIAMFTLVFVFDHLNDLRTTELVFSICLIGLYFSSLIMFSSAAIVTKRIRFMEKEWNQAVGQLGHECKRRIENDLLAFMADRETFSVKAFGRPITISSLALALWINSEYRIQKSKLSR